MSLLVLLTVGIGLWWYHDDGDLTEVRAEARLQGLPTSWEEKNLIQADDARLALWKRLSELSKKLKCYQTGPGLKAGAPDFKPFASIPDAFRAHHAELDAASIDELMLLLDQLGDQPLVLRREMTFATLTPELGVFRDLARFLQERIALADAAEAARLCRRALALCRAYSTHSLIQHLVHVSIVEVFLTAIATRLTDFKSSDPNIADTVLETTQGLPDALNNALCGEFICGLIMTSQRRFGYGESNSDNWFMPAVVRIGRREMLSAQLDAITQLRPLDLARALAWADANDAALSAARKNLPMPGLVLRGLFAPNYAISISVGHRAALRGRLLAAELRGQPWPRDSFDPTGMPLRRWERDGKLVGAYSVDSDGIDNGGDAKKDRYFPLYGPREAPKTSP